ncbi:GGDEF domain-containing protein [Tistrella bauzanensis]
MQKRTERRLSEANRRLKAYAWEDHLTGVPSRRYLDAALTREVRRSVRDGRPLAVAMLDIDHFKSFNDLYGHPAGDVCLRQVAQAAAAAIRRGRTRCAAMAARSSWPSCPIRPGPRRHMSPK